MNKRIITCAALSDDADGISTTQTPGAAGNLTITGALATGGVATLAAGQPVTITAVADETAKTFTVTGTDPDGKACTEAITGPNATTATGSVYFKTVTQIAVDAATAGAVTAGPVKSNGGISPVLEVAVGQEGDDFDPALFANVVSGTYTVEMSPDEVNDEVSGAWANGYTNSASWYPITEFNAKTADVAALLTIPCQGIRVKVTTNTSGAVTATLLERNKK